MGRDVVRLLIVGPLARAANWPPLDSATDSISLIAIYAGAVQS